MTQSQLHYQKPTLAWVTAHKSWECGLHYTASELDRLQDVLSGQVIWSEPLVAASSMQLNLSLSLLGGLAECLSASSYSFYMMGEGGAVR